MPDHSSGSVPPAAELVRRFVIAGHGNLDEVRALLADEPRLLNEATEWQPGDTETAIQAAAHMGSSDVAEFLLEQGAPLELPTAAMLGRREDVERLLAENPAAVHTPGAHGIPVLSHAAFSGDPALVALLYEAGAREGASLALFNAVRSNGGSVVTWLLNHANPDLGSRDYQGKTALDLALEGGDEELAGLLRSFGAESA